MEAGGTPFFSLPEIPLGNCGILQNRFHRFESLWGLCYPEKAIFHKKRGNVWTRNNTPCSAR